MLTQKVAKFHRVVAAFEEVGFGEISIKKSHTFGNKCLASQIIPQYQHCTNFRIVGGSLFFEVLTRWVFQRPSVNGVITPMSRVK